MDLNFIHVLYVQTEWSNCKRDILVISDKEINAINTGISIMVFSPYFLKSFGKHGVIYTI